MMILIFNLSLYYMNKLNTLPNEISSIIINMLPIYNKRIFFITCNENSKDKEIYIKLLRIKLYIKIKLQIKKLFNTLSHYLLTYDYMLYNYSTGYYPFNNQCLIYAPINQKKYLCRYCKNNRASHKYIYMMRIYNEIVNFNY